MFRAGPLIILFSGAQLAPGEKRLVCIPVKAEPGKLDIKRREPHILIMSLQVGSLFQPAVMT